MTQEESTAAAQIRALAAANGVKISQLATELKLSRTAMYARLSGDTAFLFREIVKLAEFFEVDLNRFTVDPKTRRLTKAVPSWVSGTAGQMALAA